MANIDGGELSFKSVIDNDQLNGAIAETIRRIQGLSDAVVGSGDSMDDMSKQMLQGMEIQKKVISQLEDTIKSLNDRIQQTQPGDAQNALIQQVEATKLELEQEIQALSALNAQFVNLQSTTTNTNQQLDTIRTTLGNIGAACLEQENALSSLETQYEQLGKEMSVAFSAGNDKEYRALQDKQNAIVGEIRVRQRLLKELREQSNALEKEATDLQKSANETNKVAEAHVTLRRQIQDVKEEMARMRLEGIDEQSAAYKKLVARLGELQDIQGDVATQGKIMSNDEAMFQGMLTGLNGLVGGFSAAQGAVALFAGENENLQKIMLKVQSLMSIIMGLQQVAQTLNKDSAFQLVTINSLKEWWNKLLEVGKGKIVEETVALQANVDTRIEEGIVTQANTAAKKTATLATEASTVAQGANTLATNTQTIATTEGTAANIGLAGAFRMVGAAIKSIPVFGWVIAGVATLTAMITHFISKADAAKKTQKEWYKSIADNAFKPIGEVERLSNKWKALGDEMEAKKKFVEANKEIFEELGVSIQSVTDAENLLIANKDAFLDAQIEKAKATIYFEKTQQQVKELIEMQAKYDNMSDTSSTFVQTSSFGTGYHVSGENTAKKKLAEEIEEKKALIKKGYDDMATAEETASEKLKQARIQILDKLKKSGSSQSKDPFLDKLNNYKSEYARFAKWVNSGDDLLVKSANKEFSGLLKEGATYIDYLKKQRDEIISIDIAKRTQEQNKQLRQLMDAISEETKQTVLDSYNQELSEQLGNAESINEMLNIIEQRRQQLAGDGTELDNAKGDVLAKAEEKARAAAESEINALLSEYGSYVDKKRALEEQFYKDIKLLRFGAENANNEEERASYEEAIKNRTERFSKENRNVGGVDYDALIAEFGTFEEKKQAIIDEYAEKRKIAELEGNRSMMDALNNAQAQALSNLALDTLRSNPDWELMFGDLDKVTTKKLQQLIDKIKGLNGAYLGIQFDPKDLEVLEEKAQSMEDKIQSRNPFTALIKSIKDYGEAADDEAKKNALKGMFEGAAGAIDMIKGTFDAVIGGLDKMGVKMDEETQAIIGDLSGIMDGASQVAKGIATGNPLSVIQGSIGLLSSAFDLFNSRDRKAEKRIRRHQSAIKDLENVYKQLEWQINKALGSDVYAGEKDAIKNMEEQKKHLQEMIKEEEGKKKSNGDKIKEYKEREAELNRKMEEVRAEMAADILQTNAKDFAGTLGDALVDAFRRGEDASKAFEQTVNSVMQNAIINQLKKNFLEKELQKSLDLLEKQMGRNGDDFNFDGLTEDERNIFKNSVKKAANNFKMGLNAYKDLFQEFEEGNTALTGAVKGISEETASIMSGYLNNIRLNQAENQKILTQQLQAMHSIAENTRYNRHLEGINKIIDLLSNQGESSLRSQGLS